MRYYYLHFLKEKTEVQKGIEGATRHTVGKDESQDLNWGNLIAEDIYILIYCVIQLVYTNP